MKRFNNVSDGINWIQVQKRFLGNKDLNKLTNALNKLNLNLNPIKKIHILGTNGKGSTQAFISNILKNKGYKVGSFTSPYLIKFNERIKINNENISDIDLLNLINFIYKFNLENNYNLSFFELLTLMSLKHFSDTNCDVIIMEAGIGGRLDSTNIMNYDQTIITSVGFDHKNILGNKIEQIATEKVGALKDNNTLIIYNNNKYNDVIMKRVSLTKSDLILLEYDQIKLINNNYYYKNYKINLNMLGKHQVYNSVLALNSVYNLFGIEIEDMIKDINETSWPGRFEKIKQNVYIDGAHNIDAIKALIETINDNFKNLKINIIFSALKDKDISPMIKLLQKENYNIKLTSFVDPRFASLKEYETINTPYIENINEIIKNINEDEITVFTGSIHFIGYVKELFNNENNISY